MEILDSQQKGQKMGRYISKLWSIKTNSRIKWIWYSEFAANDARLVQIHSNVFFENKLVLVIDTDDGILLT